MRKAEFNIEYTETSVNILQKDFFGIDKTCTIEIPYEHQEEFGKKLHELFSARNKKMDQSKITKYMDIPRIEIDFRISKNCLFSFSEGISNNGDDSWDAFAIYYVDENNILDSIYKTVVIKFCDLPMLINFVQKYNFNLN
jgi:hypothetical protein